MTSLKYAGFSIGGTDWLWMDLASATSPGERQERLRVIGFEEARLTHQLGGNLLRLFFSFAALLEHVAPNPIAPGRSFLGGDHQGPWYLLHEAEKIEKVDEVFANLNHICASLDAVPMSGEGLPFADMDAYFAGVRSYNDGNGRDRPVRVLLTLVLLPPRQILEMPSKAAMAAAGRNYDFSALWSAQIHIAIQLWRRVVRRYVVDPGERSIVCAFEVNNEPDYEWLPDELRIEKSQNPAASPVTKYVTELHNTQIPVLQETAAAFQPTVWGGYADQPGPWVDHGRFDHTPVLEFQWGRKFDWYIKCYAELAEHMSYAIWHEARSANRHDIAIISAGVTHNNLDYLIRMYRANSNAFTYCTAMGLHPYHWPHHNIYDTYFKSPYDLSPWRAASPREYAARYFKRFDFFKEAARLTRLKGPESFGFEGKRIWLTEFGIPTKVFGEYNSAQAKFVPFIRPRSTPPEAIAYPSAVWEDLWDAFFDQVRPDDLVQENCDAIAFFSLRETAQPHFDKHDDDRSNFALIRRDGSPRLAQATLLRFREFLRGRAGVADIDVEFTEMPLWARGRSYSTQLLRSQPWTHIQPAREVLSTISMLTDDERQFLYWCTAHYYENKGEIVELGPFVGGSSVAFAAGLRDAWRGSGRRIKVYDRFESDDFMEKFYFVPNGLKTINKSFRHIYDAQTAAYGDVLEIHSGDVVQEHWSGAPIEILFIDIAKNWRVNDHVNRTFLPHLMPGKSLVIQQDLYHQYEYWTIITMELLADYFEYVGFVKWNSAVYRCVRRVPPDVIPEDLRGLGLALLSNMIKTTIARHTDPYLVGILRAALIGLYVDFGDYDQATEMSTLVLAEHYSEPMVIQAIKNFGLTGDMA